MDKKAKVYWRNRYISGFLGLALSLACLAMIQLTGLSTHLRSLALWISPNYYLSFSIYIMMVGAIYYAAMLPLNFYEGFFLEHRFDLSNQSMASWVIDEIKKAILSLFIFMFIVEALYSLGLLFGRNWWIAASLFWIAVSAFFAAVFPVFIIPLFYKYKRLESGTLRDRIIDLAKRFNIKLLDLFTIDFSAKTRKANAALVGLGDTKRIVLADNLMNEFTDDEIEVVIAHEMAHYKMKHIWKLLGFSALISAIMFIMLKAAGPYFAGMSELHDPFDISLLPIYLIAFTLYNALMMPLSNAVSRKLEREADALALSMTKMKGPFITLMIKIGSKNLSDEDPNPLIEMMLYDHPSISQRIEMAKNITL